MAGTGGHIRKRVGKTKTTYVAYWRARCPGSIRHRGAKNARMDDAPLCTGGEIRLFAQAFNRLRDAKAHLRGRGVKADSGNDVEPTKKTVRQFVEQDWIPAARGSVRDTTFASYEALLSCHVLPRIGAVELRALTPTQLNAMYLELLSSGRADGKGGLSPRTVRYIHTVVGRVLRDAVKWGAISRNVALSADPPRDEQARTMKTWTPAQLNAFLTAAAGERLYPVFYLAAQTGMRRGEVLGLRPQDVDLDGGRITIVQSLVQSQTYEVVIHEPKTTHGKRTVRMDARTVAVLSAWRAKQNAERLKWGAEWTESNLFFTRDDGTPFEPNSVSKRFDKVVKRAEVSPIRFHDLRHTFATIALEAGEHPKVVQERLGHSSISITLDIYSHVTEEIDAGLAERMAERMTGGGAK